MTKSEAMRLAATMTLDQLQQMFRNAEESITDWEKPSRINPSLSVGAAFNVLKCVAEQKSSDLAIRNALLEFGQYRPGAERSDRTSKRGGTPVMHQDPQPLKF